MKIKNFMKEERTEYVVIALVFITIAENYFIYGKSLFLRWPWFQSSITISLLTCFWPYVLKYKSLYYSFGDKIVAFIIAAFPLDFLLVYPGAKRLGMNSDGIAPGFYFALLIPHSVGFYIVARWTKSKE